LDEKRRATQVELDTIKSESNKLSKDIGDLMKSGEKAKAEILKEKSVQLRERDKELSEVLNTFTAQLQEELYKLPNLPADIVPTGKTPEENLNVFEVFLVFLFLQKYYFLWNSKKNSFSNIE
jgi:seryl-tRNA synthetase